MENNKKLSNGSITALIILGLLTGLGLIVEIITFIRSRAYYTSGDYLKMATYIAVSVLLFYYAVVGYKKPHGNLMKYLFLVYAICCLGGILMITAEQTTLDIAYNYICGAAVVLTAFVAGRLNRFKQNVILMSIVGVLMLSSSIILAVLLISVYHLATFINLFACFTFFLLWVDLMFAYIVRYKAHKEAGLEDK